MPERQDESPKRRGQYGGVQDAARSVEIIDIIGYERSVHMPSAVSVARSNNAKRVLSAKSIAPVAHTPSRGIGSTTSTAVHTDQICDLSVQKAV
jgi:hypothetical protein